SRPGADRAPAPARLPLGPSAPGALGRCGLAALAAAALAACGDGASRSGTPADPFCARVLPAVGAFLAAAPAPPADPRRGGRVVVGGIAELPGGLDPSRASDYVAVQHQQFVSGMTLLAYDEALQPVPRLAESWTIAPDTTWIEFRLRDDVPWHDGEITDAADVAFTWRVLTDPATEFPNAAYWDHYERGPDGVEIIDARTVRLHLRPHAEFLDPWRTVAILPEHLLADVPPAELRTHPWGTRCPVGNGPFVFREHVEQERWVFQANPAFPVALGGPPLLEEYVYRIIPDENTLLLELTSGDVDVYIAPQTEQARVIAADPALELQRFPFRNVTFVAWNTRRPQLADVRVRRALALGSDRDALVDALLDGFGSVAHGTVPPFHWAFAPEAGRVPYAPDEARRLLEEAGWRDRDGDGVRENADGVALALTLQSNQGNPRLERAATILQAQWRELGVDVSVRILEWASMIGAVTDPGRRDFDGVLLSWVSEFKVDDTDLFHSSRADQPYGFAGLRSARVDSLLVRLAATGDRAATEPLWRDYQAAIGEEQPFLFLYYPDRLDGVRRRVRGVRMDARGEWVDVARWWVETGTR
ncbi:MAG: hypothetical protein KC645_13040, partial [Gemmatimonadetes bacterium]|nr:hypothetical protein [Gemmatimonadota bacterium]